MKKIFLTLLSALPLFLNAEDSSSVEFTRGYLSSKLDDRYGTSQIVVNVVDQTIIVCSWPDEMDCADIKCFLEKCCPNFQIQFGSTEDEYSNVCVENFENSLLPELNPFFPTMLAQPHMLGYSVGYRSYDRIFKGSIPVSIGDQFSLFQVGNVTHGQLYFGIEACVWAVFDARVKSLSLINADYFIALPFTYINDKFSARLRVYHESSHLGDEFLLENPRINRVNPSMEVLDLSLAYQPVDSLQLFLGYSTVLRSDESFKIQPNSIYYGLNYYLDPAKIQVFNVEAVPYLAFYFANEENTSWGLNSSIVLGYQWEKCFGRKLRIYAMAFDGYSAEGQFSKRKSKYVSINLMYGY